MRRRSQLNTGFKLVALSVAISLSACSSQGTIADLEGDAIETEAGLDFNNLDHEQVRNEYQQLIDLVDDDYLKQQIERRIAGVHMQEGDANQSDMNSAPKQGYYRNAIASYVDILEKYPNSPDNAEVLYQLAKAYDMEGQTNNARQMLERLVDRHPYFPAVSEAYFRLGDIYFSRDRYAKAEKAYRETTIQDSGKLTLNAHYMLAWSLYKQGNYNKALDHFAFVLDNLLIAEINGRELTVTEKPLVKDALHSMSLALVNLGGAQAIADIELIEGKSYQWRLYNELAEFYLEKSRYDDSAATYREYIKLNPTEARTSDFHSKLIAAYVKGGFPKLVLNEKQDFVDLYGPKSAYLAKHEAQKPQVYAQLKQYYVELAAHFHSQGQQALKKAKTSKEDHLPELAATSLLQATDYYGRYIETFASDKQVAQLRYKKADAHFENKQYDLAANEYATVAYVDKDKALANKSAYASLIAYRKHSEVLEAKKASPEKQEAWREQSVESMLTFANVFHKDERAIAVLTNAAQALFSLNQFDRAISVANGLITKHKQLSPSLKQTAYGILAHSYFQKGEYQLAQNHYTTQRRILLTDMKKSKQSDEYKDISNQIAASIYKKADAHKQANQLQLAINELLSVKKLAPQSKIRVIAQYDAVSLMLQEAQWSNAIKELKQLQKQFPTHELAVEFPRKLAFAYEKSEQWNKAALAYTQLYKTDNDPVVRQDALFIAAGLYEKIGKLDQAIVFYKDYAHEYEKPFGNRMEARYHLADLYEKTNDKTRHLYWLRRVIAGDADGGSERTERSQWLGAWANAKYGDYFAWEFNRRSLRLPLDQSMAKKNGYLQDATVRYEQASAYGILEFVTLANYKMADLYETFSNELNKAPVPKGLSPQDTAMYQDIIAQQAEPFAQLAGSIHQNNIELGWDGHYNDWISKSYDAMKRLSPVRFGKEEELARYGDEIR